jgi:hypothetical protein
VPNKQALLLLGKVPACGNGCKGEAAAKQGMPLSFSIATAHKLSDLVDRIFSLDHDVGRRRRARLAVHGEHVPHAFVDAQRQLNP